MYPVIFKFGFIQIYSYGLMVALAFLASTFLISRRVYVLGVERDFAWNLSFWTLLGGFIGGRLVYVLLNLPYFLDNLKEIFMVWRGGLVWYGAFMGGFSTGIFYLKRKRVPIAKTLDLVAPFIALGHAIGRIGCLLNGCCYGRPVDWGVYFPVHNDYLIPTQLFSSLSLIVIFIILRLLQERFHREGSIFMIYLLLYSITRFLMEFLRSDSARSYFGLTIFQVISAGVFLSVVCLWSIILSSKKKKREGA